MKHVMCVITEDQTISLTCETGQTISDVLQLTEFAQTEPCGGRGTCGKCRVHAYGALEAPVDAETSLLEVAAIRQGLRLSCRAKITGDCTVTLQKQRAYHIVSGEEIQIADINPFFQKWGAAVDIGTTTLAAHLYSNDGFQGAAVANNPQGAYGADVMTRIGEALSGKKDQLQQAVVHGIEVLLDQLAQKRGIDRADIDAMVLTGNTTMLYLLTGKNPETLSHAPFAADCLFDEERSALEMGFSFSARCYLPRCIAAFVGADITTAMLSSGMLNQNKTALLVDIGTNGELALWHQGKLLCCATAAGPAFEGAQISCGCHGVTGAIDRVWFEDGKLGFHTIDESEPIGICGSGIIDAVAELRQKGAIDETGRLKEPDYKTDDGAAARIGGPIYLTQKDIRNVQLAKSAICAGIHTLLNIAGVMVSQIQTFYIAGGFGSFIDLENAVVIGLFPPELAGVARVIGNAAETGAAMMLQDQALRQSINGILIHAKAIDLSANPYFMDQYVEGMMFSDK